MFTYIEILMNTFKDTKSVMVLYSGELQQMLGDQPSLINVLRIVNNHIVIFTIISTYVVDLIPGSFPKDFSPSIIPAPLSISLSFTGYFPLAYTHMFNQINYFSMKLGRKAKYK